MPDPKMIKRTFILPMDAGDNEIKAMVESCEGFTSMTKHLCEADSTDGQPKRYCMMYVFYFDHVDHNLDRFTGFLPYRISD